MSTNPNDDLDAGLALLGFSENQPSHHRMNLLKAIYSHASATGNNGLSLACEARMNLIKAEADASPPGIGKHVPNRNAIFLDVIDAEAKAEILSSIAKHYGISPEAALNAVTADDAEHLLEYMVEPYRSTASVLMQAHRLRGY